MQFAEITPISAPRGFTNKYLMMQFKLKFLDINDIASIYFQSTIINYYYFVYINIFLSNLSQAKTVNSKFMFVSRYRKSIITVDAFKKK